MILTSLLLGVLERPLGAEEQRVGVANIGRTESARPVALAGSCPSEVSAHTDADFGGGQYTVQAGFAEQEVAAASWTLDPAVFPIRLDVAEMIFATSNTNVTTTTEWTFFVWSGTPASGNVVAQYSSDGKFAAPHCAASRYKWSERASLGGPRRPRTNHHQRHRGLHLQHWLPHRPAPQPNQQPMLGGATIHPKRLSHHRCWWVASTEPKLAFWGELWLLGVPPQWWLVIVCRSQHFVPPLRRLGHACHLDQFVLQPNPWRLLPSQRCVRSGNLKRLCGPRRSF